MLVFLIPFHANIFFWNVAHWAFKLNQTQMLRLNKHTTMILLHWLWIFFPLFSCRNFSQKNPGIPSEEEKGNEKTLALSKSPSPVYIGQDVNVALCWFLNNCVAMCELLYGCFCCYSVKHWRHQSLQFSVLLASQRSPTRSAIISNKDHFFNSICLFLFSISCFVSFIVACA